MTGDCASGGAWESGGVVGSDRVVVVDAVARWWDGIELWVTGMPFVPQSIVVLLVVVPIGFGLARVFDSALALVLHALGRDRRSGRDVDVPSDSPIPEGH